MYKLPAFVSWISVNVNCPTVDCGKSVTITCWKSDEKPTVVMCDDCQHLYLVNNLIVEVERVDYKITGQTPLAAIEHKDKG